MRKNSKRKMTAVLVSLLLLCTVVAGGTIAFLTAQSDTVVNTFEIPENGIIIDDPFNGTTKENVKVKNTGEVPSFIRAAIVVNWVAGDAKDVDYNDKSKGSGSVSAETPVPGTDYEMTLASGTGWVIGADGYFYFTSEVAPTETTDVLISKSIQLKEKPGYHLEVEILAEGIQSMPDSAAGEAWSVPGIVTVAAQDGKLSVTKPTPEQ